jgi:hypothetical protein
LFPLLQLIDGRILAEVPENLLPDIDSRQLAPLVELGANAPVVMLERIVVGYRQAVENGGLGVLFRLPEAVRAVHQRLPKVEKDGFNHLPRTGVEAAPVLRGGLKTQWP